MNHKAPIIADEKAVPRGPTFVPTASNSSSCCSRFWLGILPGAGNSLSQNLEQQLAELEAVGTKVGPPFISYKISSRHVIIGRRLVIHPLLGTRMRR